MEKLVGLIRNNRILFALANLALYAFYGVVLGIALAPSGLLAYGVYSLAAPLNGLGICLLAVACGIGIYLFFIVGAMVLGIMERLLSIGLGPGIYSQESPRFIQWIIYSGVHSIAIHLILPYLMGSCFLSWYHRIIGCTMGKNVFINTVGLHDAYLLTIGDDVVVGGKVDISCHTFENGHLVLKGITIGNNVLIGANCYIMPGVSIGDNCDIGANSLLRKNKAVEPGSLIMPVPGLNAKDVAKLLNSTKKSKPKVMA